jgi:hypothetical protein
MIIYCANFGGKDELREPQLKPPNCELVYFTDNPKIKSDLWDVRLMPTKRRDSRIEAKWYKMHPHVLFPGETTIWIDGNYKLVGNPRPLMNLFPDMLLFGHAGKRICAYEEMDACIKKQAEQVDVIAKQKESYESRGFPKDYGLFQGNAIIRRDSETIKEFNQLWWQMVNMWSARDQISMPYAIWSLDIRHKITVYDHSEKRNWFFKSGKHRFHGTKNY